MTDKNLGLNANLAYWRSMCNQAIAGELAVEEEVALACDKACSDYLDKLDKMFERVSPVGWWTFGEAA